MSTPGPKVRPPDWLAGSIQKGLRKVGFHVQRWPPQFTLEGHLVEIIRMLDINCVLDVGANRGAYARLMRDIGYIGRIVSFEPYSESYRELDRTMRLDRDWTGHQIALGDEEGTAELQISRRSDFNSLHDPTEYGAASRYRDHLNFVGTEQVPMRRLDTLLDAVTAGIDEPRIFLKVDTQGHDLHVVRGLGQMLTRILALQVEIAGRQLYRGVPSFSEALGEYERLGYLPCGFVPVTTERDGIIVIEWDCFLVANHR